jgi:hypothetical protein
MKKVILAASLAAFATFAAAQDQRPGYGPAVTLTQAKRIAAGVIAECTKNNWNVAVAIVDPHGTLVYYEKMEDTQYSSADIAIGGDLPASDARVRGSDQQGQPGHRDSPRRLRLARRRAHHGGRQGDRCVRRERRHRRPGRAVFEGRRRRNVIT